VVRKLQEVKNTRKASYLYFSLDVMFGSVKCMADMGHLETDPQGRYILIPST
jgi:hypothetical protein